MSILDKAINAAFGKGEVTLAADKVSKKIAKEKEQVMERLHHQLMV